MVAADLIERFERVFIDEGAANSKLVNRLRSLFPPDRLEVVSTPPKTPGALSAREFSRSKRLLYVTNHAGRFFKRCPGSRPGLSCCNYFVLNWGLQCDMNCSYCYLQSFINTPMLTIYANLDQAFDELRAMHEMHAQQLRIGTGETVDSLSLDPLTLYSRELIRFFRDYPRWTLEFKTKSAAVDQFLDEPHAGNVLVSWSINPQAIITREEHGTAPLTERFAAARRALKQGHRVAFHIDPMIWHPEWRESYGALVRELTQTFTPSEVPYLSVGALRFQPEQRAMMRERFGLGSLVTRAEVFTGKDGKLRYDAEVRREMFRFVFDEFRRHSADWRIFMCMETPETWLETVGGSPFKNETLHDLFDPGVVRAARV